MARMVESSEGMVGEENDGVPCCTMLEKLRQTPSLYSKAVATMMSIM